MYLKRQNGCEKTRDRKIKLKTISISVRRKTFKNIFSSEISHSFRRRFTANTPLSSPKLEKDTAL